MRFSFQLWSYVFALIDVRSNKFNSVSLHYSSWNWHIKVHTRRCCVKKQTPLTSLLGHRAHRAHAGLTQPHEGYQCSCWDKYWSAPRLPSHGCWTFKGTEQCWSSIREMSSNEDYDCELINKIISNPVALPTSIATIPAWIIGLLSGNLWGHLKWLCGTALKPLNCSSQNKNITFNNRFQSQEGGNSSSITVKGDKMSTLYNSLMSDNISRSFYDLMQ